MTEKRKMKSSHKLGIQKYYISVKIDLPVHKHEVTYQEQAMFPLQVQEIISNSKT